MSTASLRPLLRTPLPSSSIPRPTTTTRTRTPTHHHHHQHRSMRLLRRPKRPYTFTQLITLSDGSAFTTRTTSPFPVYRSTRDTRNAPLWNPSSKDLVNVEDDEAGRLAGFRARYGRGFDASGPQDEEVTTEQISEIGEREGGVVQEVGSECMKGMGMGEQSVEGGRRPESARQVKSQQQLKNEEIDDGWDFGDDDANMLDLISSYGQEDIRQKDAPVVKKGKGKK